jgi:hypothetical protein
VIEEIEEEEGKSCEEAECVKSKVHFRINLIEPCAKVNKTPREDDGNESIYKLAAEELPFVALEELSEEVILLKVESDQMKEEDHEVVNQDYDKK